MTAAVLLIMSGEGPTIEGTPNQDNHNKQVHATRRDDSACSLQPRNPPQPFSFADYAYHGGGLTLMRQALCQQTTTGRAMREAVLL